MKTTPTVKEFLYDCDNLVADVEKSIKKFKQTVGGTRLFETSEALFAPMGTRAFAVITKTARQCSCRVIHHLFVNRDGKTRCVDCDAQYRKGEER